MTRGVTTSRKGNYALPQGIQVPWGRIHLTQLQRAQCSLLANCVGSFLETAEGERLLQRLQLQLSDEGCMEGPISCRGQTACWARHGWLLGDRNRAAGNSCFHNRNGCAVVIFFGDVLRAEKEYFKEGVEVYLQNPL